MQTVTAEQVKQAAIAAKVTRIPCDPCEVCEECRAFEVVEDGIYYDTKCACTDGYVYLTKWKAAAERINSETDEEIRSDLMRQFGFDVGEEPETMPPADGVKIPFGYESIADYTQRAKVIGGWIVKTSEDVLGSNPDHHSFMSPTGVMRISTCFVPDPNHKWRV